MLESHDQKINNPGYFEELSWNQLAGTEKPHKDTRIAVYRGAGTRYLLYTKLWYYLTNL
jgi:hypothetical protein